VTRGSKRKRWWKIEFGAERFGGKFKIGEWKIEGHVSAPQLEWKNATFIVELTRVQLLFYFVKVLD